MLTSYRTQNKPRQFWRLAKQNPKHADGLTKQAWHAYFSKLRNPVAAAQPAHALKFIVAAPTVEAVQQARVLNADFRAGYYSGA